MGDGPRMVEWLAEVWSQARLVQIVDGGEDGGPLTGRAVLVEVRTAASVDGLRVLTTAGRLTGDVCRCPGGPTVVLRDVAGEILAGASIHGFGTVSWDRSRWRNDLAVEDPAGLHLFLAEHGVADQLAAFLAPLADRLDLHEGRPQFRPAGPAGHRYLATRAVPDVLRPVLVAMTGQQAGDLADARVEEIRRRLAAAMPSPVEQARALLSWLGRLSTPAEALWGEGALVRRLLAHLSPAEIAAASAATGTGDMAMGVVNLTMHTGDDGTLAAAIGPTLRHLFPPSPAEHDGT